MVTQELGLLTPKGSGNNSPTEVHLHQCTQHIQEELEATVQLENYDTVVIMETW